MTNILAAKNVLIISPHTDDGEFGCGGTISKLLDNGTNVYFLVFSICSLYHPNAKILHMSISRVSLPHLL